MSSAGSKLNREKRRRAATYRRGYEDGVAARNDAPTDAQPVAWLRHGEETFVQNIPFGAMWISNKDDPRAFPVFERSQQPAPSVTVKALADAYQKYLDAVQIYNERHAIMKTKAPGTMRIDEEYKAIDEARRAFDKLAVNVASAALSAQVQDVACQTCKGTGKEARHQICRDCDESTADVWQLVPKEPTHEMCEAAPSLPAIHVIDDLPLKKSGWSMSAIVNRKRYLAMLAAAPVKQEGGQ
ncbi:hypothetical protein G6L96_018435 [Agrobacterium tumefaciens]|uniref:hypothetical protein n=1 Tax=Agrobacterium tumefaciens TaxID=358 RepID=UPI0015719F8A|nr:hypothetical protein [Agrobacterium tumefaciens]WCK73162.1 hypothetical protein G6L96_018435 [Agrobacterium tumefaciens]